MNLTFASTLHVQFQNRSIVIWTDMQLIWSTDIIIPEITSSEHKQKIAGTNVKHAYWFSQHYSFQFCQIIINVPLSLKSSFQTVSNSQWSVIKVQWKGQMWKPWLGMGNIKILYKPTSDMLVTERKNFDHKKGIERTSETSPIQPTSTWRQHLIHYRCKNCTDVRTWRIINITGLFISPSGSSELDCAATKKDRAERSISIGRESLKVFLY